MTPTRQNVEDEEEDFQSGEDDHEEPEAPEGDGPRARDDEEEPEASLDQVLAAKPEERAGAEEDEEEEAILGVGREDRIETLSVKVVPPDPTKEFTCRKCYLVKHRSQLADKTKLLCRDCA